MPLGRLGAQTTATANQVVRPGVRPLRMTTTQSAPTGRAPPMISHLKRMRRPLLICGWCLGAGYICYDGKTERGPGKIYMMTRRPGAVGPGYQVAAGRANNRPGDQVTAGRENMGPGNYLRTLDQYENLKKFLCSCTSRAHGLPQTCWGRPQSRKWPGKFGEGRELGNLRAETAGRLRQPEAGRPDHPDDREEVYRDQSVEGRTTRCPGGRSLQPGAPDHRPGRKAGA